MDLAEKAYQLRADGLVEKANQLTEDAFNKEKEAAELLTDKCVEPTRSVLFRSAASLAIDCKKYQEAEKLLLLALAGNPPAEIAEEISDLLLDCQNKKNERL